MTIEDWRVEIDKIDGEILRLLNLRAGLAVRVGESKRLAGLSLCDRARERAVIERVRRANPGPLDDDAIARLFRAVIRESRRLQTQAAEAPCAHEEEATR
ncbi:MAG: chorismate mutase [Acidobacteriota bacterium]|jgi:chorismate mutase|nr:chorismate mutase [Acidobacteriota bacterium]